MSEINLPKIIQASASLALAVILGYALFILFRPFFIPVITGGIIALISQPIYLRVKRALKNPGLSSAFTLIILVIIFLIPISVIISILVKEIASISITLHSQSFSLKILNDLANRTLNSLGISTSLDIKSYLLQAVSYIGSRSTAVIGGFFGALAGAFLTFISAYYLMANHERISKQFKNYCPLKPADTELIWSRAKEVIRATVSGNLTLIGIEAAGSILGFWLFGVGAPVLLGILFGIASIVPTVGSALIWVPLSAYYLLQGNYLTSIGIAVWSLAQVTLFDNLLGPKLIEKKARLHPFLALLGVLGGVGQFGILGFILGPTIVAMGIVALEILRRAWESDNFTE